GRCAPVLPYDGAMDGLARAPVPDHTGLALVGDADRGDAAGPQLGGGERLARGLNRRAPDVVRIVLHPTRGGVVLGELPLREAEQGEVGVEPDATRGCGALIDG